MSEGMGRTGSPMTESTGGSDVLADGGDWDDLPALGNVDLSMDEERRERIAMLAYSRTEGRGFDSGLGMEDWLEAERQVDDDIAAGSVTFDD